MKNQKENPARQAEKPAKHSVKKPYQTPELTIHGRVDTITKFLVSTIGMARHHH